MPPRRTSCRAFPERAPARPRRSPRRATASAGAARTAAVAGASPPCRRASDDPVRGLRADAGRLAEIAGRDDLAVGLDDPVAGAVAHVPDVERVHARTTTVWLGDRSPNVVSSAPSLLSRTDDAIRVGAAVDVLARGEDMQPILVVLRDAPGRVAAAHLGAGAEIDARHALRAEAGVQRSVGVEPRQHDVGVDERRAVPPVPAVATARSRRAAPPAPSRARGPTAAGSRQGRPCRPRTPGSRRAARRSARRSRPCPCRWCPRFRSGPESCPRRRRRGTGRMPRRRRSGGSLEIGFRMGLPFLILKTIFMFS